MYVYICRCMRAYVHLGSLVEQLMYARVARDSSARASGIFCVTFTAYVWGIEECSGGKKSLINWPFSFRFCI